MLSVHTSVKIPFLWGKSVFKKSNWAQINLIVGPNGSGKTLLANELSVQFEKAGYKTKFLRSDEIDENRLYEVLQEQSIVKSKIEKILSNMFGKSIRFEKNIDGDIVPIVVNKTRNTEYGLIDGECHGLKKILALLISLYASDEPIMIFDEPELHLHPQFQSFFMNEIRNVAESDKSRTFFLITHSPFFIDLRLPSDLVGVIVCHINRCPTTIDRLRKSDEQLLNKFLPRFNTYHKQCFFSDNQIFVEGYTDKQLLSMLLSRLPNLAGAANTGIIDVGGKDELGVFFKVCALLGTDGRIIGDLDSLFRGNLRNVVCQDGRAQSWLDKQYEKQLPFYKTLFSDLQVPNPLDDKITISHLIDRLEDYLLPIGKSINSIKFPVSKKVALLKEKINNLYNKYSNVEDLDTFFTVVLQGVISLNTKLQAVLPLPLARTLPLIHNLCALIFATAEQARVYILHEGCIEHYYIKNEIQYMPISGKDKLFADEWKFLNTCTQKQLEQNYKPLINILEKACRQIN